MDLQLARLATETLCDVSLPDGAVGVIDGLDVDQQTPMAVVTGCSCGRYWTRRVPVSVLEPCSDLLLIVRQEGVSA